MKIKKLECIHTDTYDVGDDYYVDIVEQTNEIVVWLYHKDFSYKRCIDGTRSLETEDVLYMLDRVEAELDKHKAAYEKWVTDIQIFNYAE